MITEQDYEILFKLLAGVAAIAGVLGLAGWVAHMLEKWWPTE